MKSFCQDVSLNGALRGGHVVMVTADASSAAQHLGLGHVSGLWGRDYPRLRLFLSSPIRMGGKGVYKSISVGHQEKIRTKNPTTGRDKSNKPPMLRGALKRRQAEVSHSENLQGSCGRILETLGV